MIKNFLKQVRSIAHELILTGVLMGMYITGSYAYLAPTLQTVMLKATLVSLGFLHAHVTTKISFPAIDWSNDATDHFEKALRICLYVVFIYAWSTGG